MAKGRMIRFELNHPPVMVPFTAGDQSTKLEMKYVFDKGDEIEFLDAKKEAEASSPPPVELNTTTVTGGAGALELDEGTIANLRNILNMVDGKTAPPKEEVKVASAATVDEDEPLVMSNMVGGAEVGPSKEEVATESVDEFDPFVDPEINK
jgi:hypothetical protein